MTEFGVLYAQALLSEGGTGEPGAVREKDGNGYAQPTRDIQRNQSPQRVVEPVGSPWPFASFHRPSRSFQAGRSRATTSTPDFQYAEGRFNGSGHRFQPSIPEACLA